MTQGLLVATKTKVLGTIDTYLWTINYYNDCGELVRQFKQHYHNGGQNLLNYDDNRYTYTFTGQSRKYDRYQYIGPSYADLQVHVFTEYDYDHRDRLTNTWKSVGSLTIPSTKTLIAKNDYNETVQLWVKSLHSTNSGASFD